MITNKNKKGLALISVMAITAIALIVISTMIIVAAINLKIIYSQEDVQKSLGSAEDLIDDAVLRFLRYRVIQNNYTDWTDPCLQTENIECRMELSSTSTGGQIDSWAKSRDIIRQLEAELFVHEDESVTISAKKVIY